MMEAEQAPPLRPNVNVPPGYRFKPTPRELIQYYLERWVGTEPGNQSPGEFYGIMAAADVYGEDPGTLTSRFLGHDDGNWYFLSVVRWKDGNANASSRRMNRAVGALGTWHGSGKRISVRGAGYRQSFEFRPAGGGKATWLMEEFGTVRIDATDHDQHGVRVLCRLHPRPRVAADGNDCQQQQLEADDVPTPCNKRRRRSMAASQMEHHIDADYWTAGPDGGFSSSYGYATAAAPSPPDVGCSYATTSFQAAAAAAAPMNELTAEALPTGTWQHQPTMEQAGDWSYHYHCAGVYGGVYIRADDEPQSLEIVPENVEFTAQDFQMQDSDFMFPMEQLLQQDVDDGWNMDSNSNAFSFQQLMPDGVQENNAFSFQQLMPDGVQENNAFSFQQLMPDDVQENNGPNPEPSDGVQENNDDPKPEPSDGVQENKDDDPNSERRY